MEDLINSFISR